MNINLIVGREELFFQPCIIDLFPNEIKLLAESMIEDKERQQNEIKAFQFYIAKYNENSPLFKNNFPSEIVNKILSVQLSLPATIDQQLLCTTCQSLWKLDLNHILERVEKIEKIGKLERKKMRKGSGTSL